MKKINQSNEGSTRKSGLNNFGKGLTVATIILWIVIFLAGIVINSAPFRDRMTSKAPNIFVWFTNWIVVLFVYTPTNVAILSIFAGLLGALGRCATLHVITKREDEEFPEDPINPYLSGVVRGFIVYLLIISGMIIILESPPISPTGPDQYVRLASVISVASFIVSYNPRYFGKLLHRATESIIKKKKAAKE
jgi:small-conductance mechanosensitive channel